MGRRRIYRLIPTIIINVSADINDKNKQDISYNILQIMKHNQSKPGNFGNIYITTNNTNNVLTIKLIHKDIFKTICDINYNSINYISYVTFNKIYSDTQDAEYKEKINQIINLIKQVFP